MKKYIKKYLIVMVFITINSMYGQEAPSQDTTLTNTEPQKIHWYTKWQMKLTGYNTFKEYRRNHYGLVMITTPLAGVFTKDSMQTIPRLTLEVGGLMHYKNRFYWVSVGTISFSWGDNTIFQPSVFKYNDPLIMGWSFGLGGSFYDGRNEQGQGWLAGMDLTVGVKSSIVYDNNFPFMSVYSVGLNFRGLYRSVGRTGVSLGFQILYEYHRNYMDNESKFHGISIGPKIGLVF